MLRSRHRNIHRSECSARHTAVFFRDGGNIAWDQGHIRTISYWTGGCWRMWRFDLAWSPRLALAAIRLTEGARQTHDAEIYWSFNGRFRPTKETLESNGLLCPEFKGHWKLTRKNRRMREEWGVRRERDGTTRIIRLSVQITTPSRSLWLRVLDYLVRYDLPEQKYSSSRTGGNPAALPEHFLQESSVSAVTLIYYFLQ